VNQFNVVAAHLCPPLGLEMEQFRKKSMVVVSG
jgi:hypothetical protein